MAPNNQLLQIRDQLINIYKKNEPLLMPVLKFIAVVSVLLLISNNIGYAIPLTKISMILIMGLVGVFLPPQLLMLLFSLVISLHAAAGSLGAGLIVFALLFIVYLLFVRLYPVESLFIVAIMIAYKLQIPYIIPLMAGLFSSLAVIVSQAIGMALWYSLPQILQMMENKSTELSDVVTLMNDKIIDLQDVFTTDQTLLASIVVFSAVLLVVHIIRRQSINYAEYIAILLGSIVNIIGFLIASRQFSVQVGISGLILSTLVSALIVTIMQFFFKAADYSGAQTVQFEDEQNYYFVKVVPKIKAKTSSKQTQEGFVKKELGDASHGG